MIGTFCTLVKKFERGQMFRHHCTGCSHNTAHLGDAELHCRYLEYRVTYQPKNRREKLPDRKPTIRIPADLR
ncbi:hypothetical protein ES703_45211 [subsurface metagenome]